MRLMLVAHLFFSDGYPESSSLRVLLDVIVGLVTHRYIKIPNT